MDRSTLDTRLRSLMTVLVRRRMCSAAQRQRSQILQRILRDRYVYVRNLVRDITLAKVKKVAKLKCNGVECGPSFGQNLPTAVRNLFFGTTLVHAFEKYSVDRLPTLDWELLIEQAEENLRQFNQWEGMQE